MATARNIRPDWLLQGGATTVTCPLYAEDRRTLVVPSAGTVTLTAADGTLITSGTITVVEDVGQCELELAADVPLGEGYLETWVLVTNTGTVTSQREAACVLRVPQNPVVESDLTEGRHRELAALVATSDKPDLSDYIALAWSEYLDDLVEDGRYPYRLLSSHAPRRPVTLKALALIFADAGAAGHEPYLEQADRYSKEYAKALKAHLARWDDNNNGLADDTPEVSGGSAISKEEHSRRGWRR